MSQLANSEKQSSPLSMTGFARVERRLAQAKLLCDIKSVNHRYLELSFRLNDLLKPLEAALRDELKKACSRGKFEVSLSLHRDDAILQSEELDEDRVRVLVAQAEKICAITGQTQLLDTATLLGWPGVIKTEEALEYDDLASEALSVFGEALVQFLAHRQREGAELAAAIESRLSGMEQLVETLRAEYPTYQQLAEQKLRERIAKLEVDIEDSRLAQELVLLANKADVSEELDRLETHIQEARLTLKKSEPIGRRLDFLMQEFNREANTLSSKATHQAMTQAAIEMKVLIEQIREQVQNIE